MGIAESYFGNKTRGLEHPQNCMNDISMYIITCLKPFIWKCYNKLYNEIIYLDLNKKT